jgi:D-xylose transport system substrate-binding protein
VSTSVRRSRRIALAATTGVVAAIALAACGSSSSKSPSSSSGSSGGTSASPAAAAGRIGLLLPESKTARYEAADKPDIEAKIAELCPDCKVDYYNANQDSSQQQQQVNTALANGDKVLILDAVDYKSTPALIQAAHAKGVKVIAYDRLANGGPDAYVSFDNTKVGQLQATALLAALNGKSGKLIWINGSPTDPNAGQFKAGAHSVIPASGKGGLTIGYEVDTPDWSPDKAQQEANSAIAKVGKNNIVGVYSANDGMAAGIFSALQSAGFTTYPPMTGQDAQVDGIQRIIAGQQYMTVYKAIKPEAETAATMAVDLLQGKQISIPTTKVTALDGMKVDSVLLNPVAVTKDNVKSTVVADGFLTPTEICTAAYAKYCTELGIS